MSNIHVQQMHYKIGWVHHAKPESTNQCTYKPGHFGKGTSTTTDVGVNKMGIPS